MSCLEIPAIPLPTLPDGINLPGLSVDLSTEINVQLCCKLPPISLPIPPISIPAISLNPAIIATLNAYIAQLQSYIHSIPLSCPLE